MDFCNVRGKVGVHFCDIAPEYAFTNPARRASGCRSMLFLFDCDGVLVDSEIIASQVEAEHLGEFGYPITAEEVTRRFAGLTSREIGKIVEAETGRAPPESFFQAVKAEIDRRLANELKPVPGAHEVLDVLDGPRCICSNSSSERLKISLEKTRLYDRFRPYIFSAVEVGDRRPKPAPNVYAHAVKEFGADPREAIVIEDSAFGVAAGRAAGLRVVGFTGGAHSWPGHADMLTEAGAETVIRRFADLPRVAEAFMEWGGLGD
jgi:HAD superfamily hydrolase (TIGR01509 family)